MGLFIGPVILAVVYTLLIGWMQQDSGLTGDATGSGKAEG
jgi:predicted PurR-regulated permease PerM